MTGRILVWDPPHVLEHEWKQPIVEDGVVRYELTADGDGTLLRFTHRGSACATPADSAAARTPSWIAWRPIWPATSCPSGRYAVSRSSINQTGGEHSMTTQRFRHRRARVGDRLPLRVRAHRHARRSGGGRRIATPAPTSAVIAVDRMSDTDWDTLDAADGIVFGTRDLHGQRVGGVSGVRRADRAPLPQRHLARQGRGGIHQLRRQERRQAEHPGVAGRVRGPAPHALGQPGFGRRLEQLDRQRDDLNRLGFFLGAGAQTDVDANSGPGASLRCADVSPPRAAGRAA